MNIKPKRALKKKIYFRDVLSTILFIIAFCTLFYPLIANYIVSQQNNEIVHKFDQERESISSSAKKIEMKKAKEYNDYLYAMSQKLPYAGPIPSYDQTLNIGNNKMMGFITIPQIAVKNIPVYHGDSPKVLEVGVGHIRQTSFPIGGVNTHTVLSAHSGRANNTLFSDLDKVKSGDVFYIRTLDMKLKYKIIDIKIVEPQEVSSLNIQKGRDLATLVTCYPTGVNTHRLLVTGERIKNDAKTSQENVQRNKYGYDFWVLLGSLLLAGLGIGVIIYKKVKKKEKQK